jgi:hypothetical protein
MTSSLVVEKAKKANPPHSSSPQFAPAAHYYSGVAATSSRVMNFLTSRSPSPHTSARIISLSSSAHCVGFQHPIEPRSSCYSLAICELFWSEIFNVIVVLGDRLL